MTDARRLDDARRQVRRLSDMLAKYERAPEPCAPLIAVVRRGLDQATAELCAASFALGEQATEEVSA